MSKPKYTKSEMQQEEEANYFAMCLLMPSKLFVEQWSKLSEQNIDEDKLVLKLAEIFKVPLWSVPLRMVQVKKLLLNFESK